MRTNPSTHGGWPGLVVLAIAVVVFPFAASGCGSSGGGGPPPPGPGPTPLTVSAAPAGGTYPVGSTQDVVITAAGTGSATATIYYTTDLTIPDATSTEYTGPVPITAQTVLKFVAIPTTGDPSDLGLEGYNFANDPGILYDWSLSGHGDIAAEAWRHWDEDGEVQDNCSRCHSPEGFKTYCRGDPAVPQALPYGLSCTGCHPSGGGPTLYDDLTTYPVLEPVEFPSGDTVSLFGPSNLCMTCHQGRASTVQVDAAAPNTIVQVPTDYDSYDFINVHYYAAAASYFGAEVQGGYQYAGMDYQERNTFASHPDGLSTCVGCHMGDAAPHEHDYLPEVTDCSGCHTGTSFETLGGSPGSNYTAIQTLLAELLTAIENYAAGTLGSPLIHDGHAYPYFFYDNGMGANFGNRYRDFDIALLRAAYNFNVGDKEPGGYVHNGTYIQQVLYDSIVDLGAVPSVVPPGRSGFMPSGNMFVAATQQFHQSGHDHGGAEAFRHWDEDDPPLVQSNGNNDCSRCHTSPGYEDYVADGSIDMAYMPLSTVGCYACHTSPNLYANDMTRWEDLGTNPALEPVTFPSGETATLNGNSNVCMACHSGRESGFSVAAATDNGVVQVPIDYTSYDFINIHYYAAAATYFGTDVHGAYQYRSDGSYRGQNPFTAHMGAGGPVTCVDCHMRGAEDHTWQPLVGDCGPCHSGATFETLTGTPGSNYSAIQSMVTDVFAAIQAYATGLGYPVVYDPSAYPYFFNDNVVVNGVVDPGEAIFPNRYRNFDFTLLAAAYNYQVALKDPCNYIHNGQYARQFLYDTLDDLDDSAQNNSVVGHSRP
ncbi:MAG: chitobiase/beta-hexosaminidase C-terminal domain-containing protein [Planctomycetota bacterium]|jgi:hypothetical protein